MKFSLALVCIVGAVMVANTNAQFSPFMPGFGLGFPGLPFFPTTFGRVFAPYMPHMRPGLLFRGRMLTLGMGMPGIGKRDVDQVIGAEDNNSTVIVAHHNRTLCNISSLSKVLSCKGLKVEETFECPVLPELGLAQKLRLRLADLIVKVDETTTSKVEVLKLVSRKSQGKFTFVHPALHQEEVLVVRHVEDVNQPGFLIKDKECFQKFVTLVKDVQPEKFRLTLNVN